MRVMVGCDFIHDECMIEAGVISIIINNNINIINISIVIIVHIDVIFI